MTVPISVVPTKRARDEKLPWFECDVFSKTYPNLWALLALSEVGGQPRQPATVRLFVDQQRLKAAVNDPSSELVAFITLDASMKILEQIEAYFREGAVEWREQKKPVKGRTPF